MSIDRNVSHELAAETARLGAMLAGKGLTPNQVAALVRKVQPVLAEAVQLVENGADVNTITFGIQHPGQS